MQLELIKGFGILDFDKWSAYLSYKRPFSDGIGKRYFSNRSRDLYLSAIIALKDKPIKRFSIECMRTDYQCGNGMPDPVGYDKNGEYVVVFPPYIRDKDWYYTHFDAEQIDSWNEAHNSFLWEDSESSYDFFSSWCNYGLDFGGRVLYATNGFYQQGWTVNGLCMQSPLFHSQKTVELYAPNYSWQRLYAYPNTRVIAFTFAAEASIGSYFDVLCKITLSNNTGTRGERYVGGQYSWEKMDNYYFSSKKFEFYSLLDVKYKYSQKLIRSHNCYRFRRFILINRHKTNN